MALLLRPKHRALHRCSSIRFFSSDPEPPNSQATPPSDAENPQANSLFSDIKSSLSGSRLSRPAGRPGSTQLEEIGKRLAEYRLQSSDSSTRSPITFQSLKDNNLLKDNKDNSTLPTGPTSGVQFDSIRESLQKMRINPPNIQPRINDSSIFRRRPNLNVGNIKETSFPGSSASQFVRGRMEKKEGLKRTGFIRSYTPPELGEKLRKLRPEVRTGKWFTLKELSERVQKLKEIEEKEMESSPNIRMFGELRDILEQQKQEGDEKNRTGTMQRIDILARFGPTPNYMLSPPKERLVEQYFHPDNMSSAEKMKIELQKVRDKFKKSESDCGSASVQVAQLTTKIKHLSSTLHKKDKHSRKGLQAMVQKRKKLLKYLRRTDWDSYAYLLSELGLRDNPDYKN